MEKEQAKYSIKFIKMYKNIKKLIMDMYENDLYFSFRRIDPPSGTSSPRRRH